MRYWPKEKVAERFSGKANHDIRGMNYKIYCPLSPIKTGDSPGSPRLVEAKVGFIRFGLVVQVSVRQRGSDMLLAEDQTVSQPVETADGVLFSRNICPSSVDALRTIESSIKKYWNWSIMLDETA